MSSVVLEGVRKQYGAAVAVDDLSLRVEEGEFVTLLGPSGCGKTTTLRMVAGFIDPTTGRIAIGGRDVTQLPPHKRNTGMVFQNYALFPHMTVAANVAFGLEMRRVARSEIAGRVKQALDRVRLAQYADRYPRQMSGGQQQRVALARALVIAPDVLLLDEPLSNLDAKLRGEMRSEIRELQRQLGLTAILVTHDQEEAFAVADRMMIMNAGRVEQTGRPAEVFEEPSSRFVADFIGVANLLPGRVVQAGTLVLSGGEQIRFTQPFHAADALLAIRPERLQILPAPTGGFANELPGEIRAATYLGPLSEYRIGLPSGTCLVSRQANAPDSGGPQFRPGDAVCVAWTESCSRLVAG